MTGTPPTALWQFISNTKRVQKLQRRPEATSFLTCTRNKHVAPLRGGGIFCCTQWYNGVPKSYTFFLNSTSWRQTLSLMNVAGNITMATSAAAWYSLTADCRLVINSFSHLFVVLCSFFLFLRDCWPSVLR